MQSKTESSFLSENAKKKNDDESYRKLLFNQANSDKYAFLQ